MRSRKKLELLFSLKEEITLQLGIIQGAAYALLHNILGFCKVSTRLVSKHLIEEHKRNCQHICSSLLERCDRNGNNLLNHITEDETWDSSF